jgi:glycosyltransferase involved in cell wall biosynthesis
MMHFSSLSQSIANPARLMLFDLALGGHHGIYIQHLIDRVCKEAIVGTIDIVVLPQFLDVHRDTITAISSYRHPTINLVPISVLEAAALGARDSGLNRALRNFREWQIFCKYAQQLQTTHALIMYLDTCELPLSIRMHSPCPFSGIYFRPTFHYSTFANYHPDRKQQLQQWRNRIALDRILGHPQLETMFCLDPFAVKALVTDRYHAKIVHLADPVEAHPLIQLDLTTLRTKLGIEIHRRVFLLFGALDGRKGIYQLLEAIELLPPELSQQLCLLLVGNTNETERAQMHPKIGALRQTAPIQLVEYYDFIPEQEVSSYFQLADVILAPYQRHVGMSGILLLAAAAGKPVLSSDYGLMGELVRLYQLGLAVDVTKPTEIARALSYCLGEESESLGDRSQMEVFAEHNSIERYASTILSSI